MHVDAGDDEGLTAGERRFLVGHSAYKYVVLGDSYSSGEGVDPYFRDGWDSKRGQTGTIDNRCHRSTRAYAEYVEPPPYQRPLYELASGGGDPGTGKNINKFGSELNVRSSGGVSWVFLACAGARTFNVLPAADGGVVQNDKQFKEQYTQLDSPFVDFATDVVTITIGGNDAGFVEVLKTCATSSCNTSQYRAEREAIIDGLRDDLELVFTRIRERTFNARLIVLGYPFPLPDSPAEQSCAKLLPFWGKQDMVRDLDIRLNGVIRDVAIAAKAEYEDVTDDFENHEVCGSSGDEWLNATSLTAKPSKRLIDDESFHPTLAGQRQGYAAAINARLAS